GISSHLGEQSCRIASLDPRGMKSLGIILRPFAGRPMPALDRRGGPFPGLVAVTIVAGIGRAELCRQIRPGDAEAVVVAAVGDHIGPPRHGPRPARHPPIYTFLPVPPRAP